MAEESTPVAAPVEAVTEATPNTTPAEAPTTTEAQAEPAKAPEAPAEKPYFSNDQLSEMQKFIEANGGYEKAWSRMKGNISSPQSQATPQAPEAPAQPQMAQQPVQQPEASQNAPQGPRAGTFGMEELMAQNYFERLANEEKYANIADEVRNGEVLKGLKNFNINPITDGRINDADIRKYLDLYAASKPPKPTSSEPTASQAMADDISNIKEITNMDEANRIEMDDIRRKAAGQPGNPLAAKAREFAKNYYKNQASKAR